MTEQFERECAGLRSQLATLHRKLETLHAGQLGEIPPALLDGRDFSGASPSG
jgi:hypothetical protein